MVGISTNPLGRTQQAGQGTAFIYNGNNPLDKLYNVVLQQQQQKAKAKGEKDKLTQQSANDLRTNILKITDKVRFNDIPEIQGHIDEIFDYLKTTDGDAFNPMSPNFAELNKKLANLNTIAGGSQNLAQLEKDALNKYNTNPTKFDKEEYDRFFKYISSNPTSTIMANQNDPNYSLQIKERLLTPDEYITKSKILPNAIKVASKYADTYKDANLTDEMQKDLNETKFELIQNLNDDLLYQQEQGRIDNNLTPDELLSYATSKIEPLFKKIGYDPNKDEDQKYKEDVLAFQKKKHADNLALGWFKANTSRTTATKEPQPTNTDLFLVDVLEKDGFLDSFNGIPTSKIVQYTNNGEPIFATYGKIIKKDSNSGTIRVEIINPIDNSLIEYKDVTIAKNGKGVPNTSLYNDVNRYAIDNEISYQATTQQGKNVSSPKVIKTAPNTNSKPKTTTNNTQKKSEKKYVFKNGKLILE